MRRQAFGRDLGLSIRMALALLPVLALYALAAFIAIAILIIAIEDGDPRGILGSFTVTLGWGGAAALHVLGSDRLVLKSSEVDTLEAKEKRELQTVVARTAAAADLPAPRVALIRSSAPNALAVGLTPRRATVALTTGLVRRLEAKEIEAVIAHELAHVANRDGAVMTFVSAPCMLGDLMRKDGGKGWVFFHVFYWPVYVLVLLLMWAMSRYREYTADRGSALITGAPENLMSALVKIAEKDPRGDLRGGAAMSALCIVPAQRKQGRLAFLRRFEIFMDHPPLEKRLRRLGELAGEMGRPVA